MTKEQKMNTVPTAREFYDAHYSDDPVVIMRDFAKLHVEAALKTVWANSHEECHKDLDNPIRVIDNDEELILNSYPLTNIK